jgi:dephospho-CoA kinase
MAFAIAFAGKIGSGKTTISVAVANALACDRASFGDYVRHVVSSRGLELTRDNLQRIGTEMLEADRPTFCRSVLEYSGWTGGNSIVIDGLRHSETIPLLSQLLSPVQLRIVYMDIDERTRLERLGVETEVHRETVALADAHSSEHQVTTVLRGRADLIVDSSWPIDRSVKYVLEWMAKQ